MSDRKCAIITGASSGIGAAIAKKLANQGCNIIINYLNNKEGAKATLDECRGQGVEAELAYGNIELEENCKSIVKSSIDIWGRIDVLINNSGITRFPDENKNNFIKAEDFAKIFSVNVTGSYQMSHITEPYLKKNRGSIVNISSHSGFSGMGSSIAYAASKGALNTMTLGLARSFSPEVRVNAICPGFVDTKWMEKKVGKQGLDEFKNKAASISPLMRIVSPEEVAEASCWFALGGNSITGQLLIIDGGTHLTINTPI